jgi:hypothetical protein
MTVDRDLERQRGPRVARRLWLLLAVNVLVAATAGALVALVASYLRTRGQNLATVLIRRMSKIGVTNRHRWKKS